MVFKSQRCLRHPRCPWLLVMLATLVLWAWPLAGQARADEGSPYYVLFAFGGGYSLSSGQGKGANHFTGGGLVDLQMGVGWYRLSPGFGGVTGAFDFRRRYTANVVQDSSIDAGVVDYLFTLSAYWGLGKGSVVGFGSLGASGTKFAGHQGEEINFSGGVGLAYLLPIYTGHLGVREVSLFVEPRIGAFLTPTKNLGSFWFYDGSVSLGVGY